MSYNTSTHVSTTDRTIAGLLAAGVTFILGYTVVRANLAQTAQAEAGVLGSDVEVVVPHAGTMWTDVGTDF